MNCSLVDARSRVLALETVAELRTVLDDVYEETAIRHLAAQRLGQLGEAGRIALQGAFAAAKENPPGRVAALQALVRYFPKESEATLLEALDDPWPRVRRSARLLLQDTQNLLSPDFRFQFHLSTFLSHIPDVGHVKPETLSIREQAAFWEAVGKARFPSALPSLIATLANFDQSTVVEAVGPWFKTIEYSELRTDLQEAVQSFGDKAVPFLITTLLSYPKTPDLLFHALAQMDTHIAKQALFSFQETDLKQKALYWIAWRQRWLARRAKKPKLLATSSFSTITTPLSQMDFEFCSRMIFDIRSRHVHHSIAALKFEVNPEVGVLFWVLADDPAHSRQLRQLAHNGLEFWRRYNGRGKR